MVLPQSIFFQFVTTHLLFLQYVLQEGVLYLPWNRAREIWGTLVASTEACDWDKEVCTTRGSVISAVE